MNPFIILLIAGAPAAKALLEFYYWRERWHEQKYNHPAIRIKHNPPGTWLQPIGKKITEYNSVEYPRGLNSQERSDRAAWGE